MPTTITEPHPTSAHSRPTDRPRAAGVVRVVIADDHPVYRDGVIRALMESGRYEIVGEAADGQTALRLIEERRPDVALLDLRMPVLDALGVLRRLNDEGVRVPIVLLSAFTQPQIIDHALAAGAAGYLSKSAPARGDPRRARCGRPRWARRPGLRRRCRRAAPAGPRRAGASDVPTRRLERGRASRAHGTGRRRGRAPPPRGRDQAGHEKRRRHARARPRVWAPGLNRAAMFFRSGATCHLFFVRIARWHHEQLDACPVCGYAETHPEARRTVSRRSPARRAAAAGPSRLR